MDEDWVILCFADGETEGNAIRESLESEKVPVVLRREAKPEPGALVVRGLGDTKILVPCSCMERARRILSSPRKPPT